MKGPEDISHGQNLMTQFTREVLGRRFLELEVELKLHQQEMGSAIGKGDEYHDNFAYEEASRMVDITSTRLSQMRDKLYDVIIIEPKEQADAIAVGNGVVVRFTGESEDEVFTLLGPDDANLQPGWISYESPLGMMLLGKKVGDQIGYQVEGVPQQVTVKKVLPGSF